MNNIAMHPDFQAVQKGNLRRHCLMAQMCGGEVCAYGVDTQRVVYGVI